MGVVRLLLVGGWDCRRRHVNRYSGPFASRFLTVAGGQVVNSIGELMRSPWRTLSPEKDQNLQAFAGALVQVGFHLS